MTGPTPASRLQSGAPVAAVRWVAQLAMAALVALMSGPAGAGGDCQVDPPVVWQQGRVLVWDGPCLAGKADGVGVVRAYRRGHPTEIFYGRVEAGQLAVGVLESAEGYRAGPFKGGDVGETDRSAMIAAFELASQAARDHARRLQAAGNAPSAALYTRKAQELARQMD